MDDLISRRAAIDGFYEMASDIDHLCTVGDYISFLESLSAQPEPKTGHWIPILRDSENDEYRCSVCSQPMGFDYDYCPHCGARMTIPTYPSNSIN